MTAYDQKLLDSLAEIVPLLTPAQKEKLLSFGEGLAAANRDRASLNHTQSPSPAEQISQK